ncbi:hypothetical protein DM02DRAFT_527535 [Periconia macrospinosa]|uniref:Aminoglycoside phosphotransferase domain-containing protein n=1 Tax=Periconia macrospinosa TaxID=97972 RepID=A0A2V1DSL3_9PLEO|nr:hypothetical protein DM02DRAFT_527535 [Periconia macrospinosa]
MSPRGEQPELVKDPNTHGDGGNNCDDDAVSDTSTLRYGEESHEPFETFKDKVAQLAAEIFPKARKINIERMKGGSYNRTVAVTVFDPVPNIFVRSFRRLMKRPCPTNTSQQYVFRIPRSNMEEPLEQQVAVLKMVGAKLSLPVPKVIKYDTSIENVLKKQYVVQRRIEGQNLMEVLFDLNAKQWESLLRNVMELTKAIADFHSESAGEIAKSNLSATSQSDIQLEKFHVPGQGTIDYLWKKPVTWPSLPQDSLALLLEQCERWREYGEFVDWPWDYIWDGFTAISHSLHKRGFLEGPFSLVHGDLEAYNLMVKVKDDTVEITGLIDWDFALFAPKFMAYRAPHWAWLGEAEEGGVVVDQEVGIDFQPKNEIAKQMKAYFLEHASEEWKKLAFAPEAILARRMFTILRNGLDNDWELDEAKAILSEWDQLHPEEKIPTTWSFDSDNESE